VPQVAVAVAVAVAPWTLRNHEKRITDHQMKEKKERKEKQKMESVCFYSPALCQLPLPVPPNHCHSATVPLSHCHFQTPSFRGSSCIRQSATASANCQLPTATATLPATTLPVLLPLPHCHPATATATFRRPRFGSSCTIGVP
jgi:hypothetical protein